MSSYDGAPAPTWDSTLVSARCWAQLPTSTSRPLDYADGKVVPFIVTSVVQSSNGSRHADAMHTYISLDVAWTACRRQTDFFNALDDIPLDLSGLAQEAIETNKVALDSETDKVTVASHCIAQAVRAHCESQGWPDHIDGLSSSHLILPWRDMQAVRRSLRLRTWDIDTGNQSPAQRPSIDISGEELLRSIEGVTGVRVRLPRVWI